MSASVQGWWKSASSWNDDGFDYLVKSPYALRRTGFFPGLGWLMTRALWRELRPKWPPEHWDHWLRLAVEVGAGDFAKALNKDTPRQRLALERRRLVALRAEAREDLYGVFNLWGAWHGYDEYLSVEMAHLSAWLE